MLLINKILKMKVISYNVNGIRAAMKKEFIAWLTAANPDVLCLQEIKAQEDQIDKDAFTAAGYAYQYYYSAQKKVILEQPLYLRSNQIMWNMEPV